MKNKKLTIVVLGILIIVIYILKIKEQMNNNLYEVDKNGNENLLQAIDTSLVNTSHIITTGNFNSNATYNTIYTFDENGKLIIQRDIVNFSNVEDAQNYYNELQQTIGTTRFNLSLKETTVLFNSAPYNVNKEQIIELCTPNKNNTVTQINIY